MTRPAKISQITAPVPASQSAVRRDIVVVGGSAGSYPAVRTIVASLNEDFHAAVFVVIHTHPRSNPGLDRSLGSAATLPTTYAADGMPIEPGKIYIAPPDRHLLLANDHIHVARSPKEGLHRPSINVTFRSAAHRYGRRVIGVLLSGMLDDGASGLWEIAKQGGLTIVQSAAEAQFDSMPLSALKDAPINYELPAAEIASILPAIVEDCELPPIVTRMNDQEHGKFSGFTCPECRGPLFEHHNGPVEFRCRVGHAFPLKTLLDESTSTQERKLYEAIVALEEGADMADYAAAKLENGSRLRGEAAQLRRQAAEVRKLIENRVTPEIN